MWGRVRVREAWPRTCVLVYHVHNFLIEKEHTGALGTKRVLRTYVHPYVHVYGGLHHSAYVEGAVERAAEANHDHHQQQTVSFATDPCHGLYCNRR